MARRYRFIVNCNNEKTCKIVRQEMRDNGFKYIRMIKNDLQGDHSGTREFASLKKAETEAERIFHKYSSKIYQITIRHA